VLAAAQQSGLANLLKASRPQARPSDDDFICILPPYEDDDALGRSQPIGTILW
jgi:hypothetical protein